MTVEEALRTGAAHHRGNRLREAEQIYRQVLAQYPNHADAIHLLALLAAQVGRHEDARTLGERAVALKGDVPRYWHQLGDARRAVGDRAGAEAAYRRAVEVDPKYAQGLNQLGDLLAYIGRPDEAMDCFRRAIALQPELAEPHFNLGRMLVAHGRDAEGAESLRRATELRPDFPQAWADLGTALLSLREIDAAGHALERAIALRADAIALNSLGLLRMAQGRIDEAVTHFRRAVDINPSPHMHGNLLLAMNYSDSFTAEELLAEHRRWAQRHETPLLAKRKPHENDRSPTRRLRVGYVSPDFRQHPVGFFMRPVIERHDRQQVEVYCYALSGHADEMTEALKNAADAWRALDTATDDAAAEMIRADGIDILIDLAGHTAMNRLAIFARKPAPVQITYLGYVNTTGLSAMDYILADRFLLPRPEQDASCVSEKVIRLPRAYLCYQPPVTDIEVGPLPAAEAGFVTFASLNRLSKVTPAVLDRWMEIIRRVPESRLILHGDAGEHGDALRKLWLDAGLEPQRLELIGRIALRDYFALHNRIDIALDPFPHNGGTTTCDALWMGVPVVSFPGRTAVSRAGMSLLSSANVPEFVAESTDAYVQLAVALASDLPRLAEIRSTLRPRLQASPLMDVQGFVRDLESAYRDAWRTWCDT